MMTPFYFFTFLNSFTLSSNSLLYLRCASFVWAFSVSIVSPLANNIEFVDEKEEKQPKATDNAFMENNAPLPEVEDEEFEEEDEE